MRTRFFMAAGIALTAAVALTGCGSVGSGSSTPAAGSAGGDYVNVVKITGIAWFDRMSTGVKAFADESGIAATQTGPSTGDTAQQVSVIQSVIAQKPTVLGVVPLDPDAVQNVIKQAKDAGIIVVTHEAPTGAGGDADIEPFENKTYGEGIMTSLAKCMGETGEYVQFVGSLTSETHMEWAAAGQALQQAQYPDMSRLGDPNESNDNADVAYEKTKQLLQANPNLKGIFGDSSQDVVGAGRAVQELGLQDDVCVYGTGVPSETKEFLKDGSIDGIFLWDPAAAGQAMMAAGQILADGGTLETGTDLGVDGYDSLTQSADNPTTFIGNAPLAITADNVDQYDF